ncbi:hypothetical protein AWB68_04978 [Caballeronia choica]|uniref:Uncharacterized protein n=1 Tax=Caballeronia choica TaxID=326476 RepID=A0A158K5J8_9BURK|nr:hypothetical protein AWB68_04978 [Caballeronia choica]
MRLVALEFLERRQIRIRIPQPDDEADHHLVVVHVIEKRAAVGVVLERPAGRVDHETGLVLDGIDFPQFLDAEAVDLRVGVLAQLEPVGELTAEMPARAFAEERVFRVQFHAELEVLGRLAVLADAHVAGDDAAHRAVFVIKHFGCGKTRKDFDAERLCLLTEPARDVREADDIVAVILEVVGQEPVGHLLRAVLRQEQEAVLGHFDVERRAFFLPVGDQFIQAARVHDGARENVGADLGAFFQHAHADLDAFFLCKLLEPDGRRQSGGAAADDHDVVFHRLAGTVLLQQRAFRHAFAFSNPQTTTPSNTPNWLP